jgi:hypothetical protein
MNFHSALDSAVLCWLKADILVLGTPSYFVTSRAEFTSSNVLSQIMFKARPIFHLYQSGLPRYLLPRTINFYCGIHFSFMSRFPRIAIICRARLDSY